MRAILVETTCDTEAEARAIARAGVEARLAACAHLERIASVYRWEGAVHEADEWRVRFKTMRAAWPALAEAIRVRHSYEEPAIIGVEIAEGAPSYLAWIEENSAG